MRVLLPFAIAAAVLAIPAPAHELQAEINSGCPKRAEPYRFAIAYQFGRDKSGKLQPLHFGFSAALTRNAKTKAPEFHVDGDFGLRLPPARLPRLRLQSSPVFPGAQ